MRHSLCLIGTVTTIALPIACGAGDMVSSPPQPSPSNWVEATPATLGPPCLGQRAFVPRAGNISVTAASPDGKPVRTEQPAYVAYQIRTDEVFAYLSFDPSLPDADFSTETARTLLKYAYLQFDLRQPAGVGGSLTLLSSLQLLGLADFERLEVKNRRLEWRIVRRSAQPYSKQLTTYDEDPSNDPHPADLCVTDDIVGICYCEFGGPPITVTVDGSIDL